jgi:hypothetical protein
MERKLNLAPDIPAKHPAAGQNKCHNFSFSACVNFNATTFCSSLSGVIDIKSALSMHADVHVQLDGASTTMMCCSGSLHVTGTT